MAEHTAAGDSSNRDRSSQHITEDEASLYDRQIRLWGLEAQNRMRSSTVLLLSLRSLGHETIKNLVLAGIGRLIVMDDGVVTADDLSSGFLFREEDGALGQPRSTAAAPQIESLNPLVSLTALPTLTPFVRDPATAAAAVDTKTEMIDFLQREKVDVVVACDLKRDQIISIDDAAREAGVMFYAAGTYGFYGYVFADLGKDYEYVYTPPSSSTNPSPPLSKKKLSYGSFTELLDGSEWFRPSKSDTPSRSPFRDLTRMQTKERDPLTVVAILALWEYEKRYGLLPSDSSKKRRRSSSDQGHKRSAPGAPTRSDDSAEENMKDALPKFGEVTEDESNYRKIYTELQVQLGLHPKFKGTDRQALSREAEMISQLSKHADMTFPPTLAILGGLLAQDVLRALSKKDKPIVNLLAVDSMGGTGAVNRWVMADAVDA